MIPITSTIHRFNVTLIVVASGFACLIAAGNVEATSNRPPNVLLIMADDVSWECFGCYGAEDYQTPRLDQLASEGVRFNHCYSTPLCTPSRVMLMTGKYNFRNYTHFGYLDPDETTFGHQMQSAGYRTAIAGKWQLNGLYDSLPGYDDTSRPQQAGFHESLCWQVTRAKNAPNGGERFWNPVLERNGQVESSQSNRGRYGPDLLTDFLCDFMERNREQPFFAYYPMVLVHDPFTRTPWTIGDQPLDQANKEPRNPEQKKANFVAMVHYMDHLVGRLVDKIDSLGLSEQTIVIFTADNGTHRKIQSRWRGQTIQGGKGQLKDMGT
ncbi:MAG: sulfatase-like hydrolase/transferase, partial [Planctomycetota bacterium]